jgi:hypothetical protein
MKSSSGFTSLEQRKGNRYLSLFVASMFISLGTVKYVLLLESLLSHDRIINLIELLLISVEDKLKY